MTGIFAIPRLLRPGDRSQALPTLLSDINMLVLTGGQERTNADYGALLEGAGLRLSAVRPVAFPYGFPYGVIEAVPAGPNEPAPAKLPQLNCPG